MLDKLLLILQLVLKPPTLSAQQDGIFNLNYTDSAFYFEGLTLENKDAAYENEYARRLDIANRLYAEGKHRAAIFWLETTLSLPNLSTAQKANTYGGLSYIMALHGDYSAAIDAHLKAMRLTDDEVFAAKLKITIANTYLDLLDHELALKTVNESIQVLEEDSNYFWMATGLGIKGNIYKDLKQEEEAVRCYIKSAKYNEMSHSTNLTERFHRHNTTLNNIASAFLALGQVDSAIYYLDKTRAGFDSIPGYIKAGIYLNYGEAYASLDDFKSALSYITRGLQIAEYGNMHDLKVTAYKSLAALYSRQRDFKKAWEYEQKYVGLYIEGISEENRSKIIQLRTDYALEKKDKEIAQKELQYNKRQLALQRRNNQLYFWMVSIGLSVLIIGILLRNQYNKNRFLKLQLKNTTNESLLNQAQASLEGEASERERIAAELHDHVVSELMAIQLNLKDMEHYHPELRQSQRYEGLRYQMEEVTDQLRRTTHNMMPLGLKEAGLANTIETFLYRISNHQLLFSFQCFGEKRQLKDSTEKILLAIVHELVQNVVKHARATEALVQLNYYEDSLSLTVEDDGVGIPLREETGENGLGWRNIRRNVAALSGTVDIQSSEQEGTTVLIEIPL